VGVLVKWLGIMPSVAYNLIIPTIFSLIAMGAFSVAWNLVAKTRKQATGAGESGHGFSGFVRSLPFGAGIAGALGMAVLGNLGIVRMIYQGFQRLAAPGGNIEGAFMIERLIWAVKGGLMTLIGSQLPYGLADWYWNPSRVIRRQMIEPITEFPSSRSYTATSCPSVCHAGSVAGAGFRSILYSARPEATGRTPRSFLQIGASLLLGGLAIGALRPTNTWDFPTYLVIGLVRWGMPWSNFEPGDRQQAGWLTSRQDCGGRLLPDLRCCAGVDFLLLFEPYARWYVQVFQYRSLEGDPRQSGPT
jgi:hypothetical protein